MKDGLQIKRADSSLLSQYVQSLESSSPILKLSIMTRLVEDSSSLEQGIWINERTGEGQAKPVGDVCCKSRVTD